MGLKDDLAASTPELKPCPFCGGVAQMREDTTHSTAAFIGCETLGCFGHAQWEETEAGAIAAWNTRTPDMAAALIEAEAALVESQSILADLSDRNAGASKSEIVNAWARCVSAEQKARSALARIREVMG